MDQVLGGGSVEQLIFSPSIGDEVTAYMIRKYLEYQNHEDDSM